MLTKVKALVPIRDGGHHLSPGQVDLVLGVYARDWIERGWAEVVKAGRPRKVATDD